VQNSNSLFPTTTTTRSFFITSPPINDLGCGFGEGNNELQQQNDEFHRQVQHARDMYARSGDTSGFQAVMALAPNYVGDSDGFGVA
jgi:hypothetical protein